MLDDRPIGVFDSGIGGLTVVKNLMNILPNEDIIYFGDIARIPYGTKSRATIQKFAAQTAKFLIDQEVKAIIIACNTISAIAKDIVEEIAKTVPVIDVISAGVSLVDSLKTVGVIATPATINSNAYALQIHKNLLAVVSGFMFVDDLFAQHLVHKTTLSLLALALFGLLVAGRQFAGWRGKRAVYLYLWGFFMLCLAYFGSRYVLEQVLGRSWG